MFNSSNHSISNLDSISNLESIIILAHPTLIPPHIHTIIRCGSQLKIESAHVLSQTNSKLKVNILYFGVKRTESYRIVLNIR